MRVTFHAVPRRQRTFRRERGAAAVEFALVLPLFATLVMAGVDFGYYFFSTQVATNAAREGARAGTIVDPVANPPSTAAKTSATTSATSTALQYLNNNGLSCPSGGSSCITATYTTVSGSPTIDVVIKYASKSLTGFTGFALPTYVYAHAAMRWE